MHGYAAIAARLEQISGGSIQLNMGTLYPGSTKGAVNMLNLGFRVKELMGGLDWWKRDGHETHVAVTSETSISCGCE